MATIRVLSLGTKFIPKWDKTQTLDTFKWFNEFKNNMNTKVYFSENKPSVFEKNKNFRLKNYFVPPSEYMAFWNIRDAINIVFDTDITEKQNL